jgi:L-alanine-DL-glutamate epimerase-like enolase superfamily enzyme
MKIAAVETVLYRPDWGDDPFARRDRVFAVYRVRTDEGLEGIGRGWAEQRHWIDELLAPILVGEDPRDLERLWARMFAATIGRHGQEPAIVGAIGALDVALWDIVGKSVGLPCWRLLGGYRSRVPAYADVPTRAGTPEELGEQLAACVAAGYRAVKFHVLNREPDSIVAQARAARRAIGPGVRLMVDFFRWLDVPTAIDAARRIEEHDLFWLEEPAPWHDQPRGLAAVARARARYTAVGRCSRAAACASCRRTCSAPAATRPGARSPGWPRRSTPGWRRTARASRRSTATSSPPSRTARPSPRRRPASRPRRGPACTPTSRSSTERCG